MEQIIATHTVKPLSPTPLHLKTHKLSSIDQLAFPIHITLIFFYENGESEKPTEISGRLKQSLSKILSMFYPLAGRMRENSYVDCNDSGVEVVEARVHGPMVQFTQPPDAAELKQLLPTTKEDVPLYVKVSYFDCGGFSVGVCFSHKNGDMASFVTFMNAWAATSRGETSDIIPPSFDEAFRFPPVEIFAADDFTTGTRYFDGSITPRRLVFEREKLEKLKMLQASTIKDPTRVEALSAFIWKTAIEAYKAKSERGMRSSFAAFHTVNLRPRIVPPIPEQTMGNYAPAAIASVSWEEDEMERERESGLHASKLRETIRGTIEFYINHEKDSGKKFSQSIGGIADMFNGGNCAFSSWWRFPMYDVDFGWGKPVWIGTCALPYRNSIVLMSTPSRDGIEAWATIPEDIHDFISLLRAKSDHLLRNN